MLEKDIEKILVKEVKELGGRTYKWVSPGNAGVPDRIVIFPYRKPVFVELKTDVGRLSSLQKVQIKRLYQLGQSVNVVYGINGLGSFFMDHGFAEVGERIWKKYKEER